MKWFLIYAVLLFGLWQAIDLKSDSFMPGVLAPLAFGFVLIAFLIWLSSKTSGRSSANRDMGVSSIWSGGGDSGGGDGGC
jgi:glycerol uptake facilitator-like aquaporin